MSRCWSSACSCRRERALQRRRTSPVGTLLCYPATDALLDGVRDALAPLGLYAGASLTDRLLTVRFLSDDNLICQRVMRDVWQFLRPHLTGKSPVLPRIWLT